MCCFFTGPNRVSFSGDAQWLFIFLVWCDSWRATGFDPHSAPCLNVCLWYCFQHLWTCCRRHKPLYNSWYTRVFSWGIKFRSEDYFQMAWYVTLKTESIFYWKGCKPQHAPYQLLQYMFTDIWGYAFWKTQNGAYTPQPLLTKYVLEWTFFARLRLYYFVLVIC